MKFRSPLATAMLGLWANIARLTRFSVPLRLRPQYKQRILAAADDAKGSGGGIGALLRREGLYSSLLATWRRERDAGVLQALTPQKRGPKSKRDPVAEENQRLRRETARLTEELRKAAIVIDIQKKH
jgi:transposase